MKLRLLALAFLIASTGPILAAFGIFQTYQAATVSQVTCNLVTGVASVGGPCASPTASCPGDKQTVTLTISTPPPFSPSVTVFSNQFTGADVGKAIGIPGIGNGGGEYHGTITAVGTFNGTSQTVTVTPNTGTQVTSQSKVVTYGTDAAPALKAFNTWAQANQGSSQVVLTIPNGSTCWIGTNQIITQPIAWFTTFTNYFFAGINNLIVEGTGATIDSVGGQGVNWGALGQMEQGLTSANGMSARIQSASVGATQVTLTSSSFSAGYISRFSVGTPVMISGMDIQTGYNQNYGVPSNHHFFNYAVVTAICNNTAGCPGTATITFDKPLTWAVLDTWPEYFAGGPGQLDQGGPATIYALHPFYNATVEYRGLNITDQADQSYAKIRNVTFRNVTISSKGGIVPTANENFTFINVAQDINASPGWEVDKLITNITLNGFTGASGGIMRRIDFQSSSVDNVTFINSNIGSMFGTPKNSQITDTHFDLLRPGAWTNGVSVGTFVCTRCDVTSFGFQGGVSQGYISGTTPMSGGVITIPNSLDTIGNGPPHRVFVPGGNVFLSTAGYSTVGILQNTAQTQDATNVYVQTNQSGGLPTIAGYNPSWRTQAAPQFTCDACTGDPMLVATNIQNGATPLTPMATYGKRTYSPTAVAQIGSIAAIGKLVSLTVDVTTAFAGTGTPILNPTAQFHNFTVNQSTWTDFDWFPSINLKQVGKRVITPGGVTCDTGGGPVSGGCAGDTINSTNGYPPNAVWIQNQLDPWANGTFTGMTVTPTFTITMQTDQTP